VSELALFLVRTGFLVLLWIFIFSIISVIRADLFGQKVVSKVAEANIPAVFLAPAASNGVEATKTTDAKATKLLVTEGAKTGFEIALSGRQLTIGRAGDSDLIVDDEYASTHHAKIVFINGEWLVQDLDSTNGTFLDGQRVGTPLVVPMNTQVRVGQTTFELRS
jgi:pSer/pThr/pTyr-binding forkhead associated (FHA) protein